MSALTGYVADSLRYMGDYAIVEVTPSSPAEDYLLTLDGIDRSALTNLWAEPLGGSSTRWKVGAGARTHLLGTGAIR